MCSKKFNFSFHYFASYLREVEWPSIGQIIILTFFEDESDIFLSPAFGDLSQYLWSFRDDSIFARGASALRF